LANPNAKKIADTKTQCALLAGGHTHFRPRTSAGNRSRAFRESITFQVMSPCPPLCRRNCRRGHAIPQPVRYPQSRVHVTDEVCILESWISILRPSALSPQPTTLSTQPSNLSPQPSAHNPQHSTLNPQPSALSPQHSALSPQPSALSTQPSALNPQPSISTLSPQSSALNPQPSALSTQLLPAQCKFFNGANGGPLNNEFSSQTPNPKPRNSHTKPP
jgi:hypothetical protein